MKTTNAPTSLPIIDIVMFGVVKAPGTIACAINKNILVSIGAAKADDNKTRDDRRNFENV